MLTNNSNEGIDTELLSATISKHGHTVSASWSTRPSSTIIPQQKPPMFKPPVASIKTSRRPPMVPPQALQPNQDIPNQLQNKYGGSNLHSLKLNYRVPSQKNNNYSSSGSDDDQLDGFKSTENNQKRSNIIFADGGNNNKQSYDILSRQVPNDIMSDNFCDLVSNPSTHSLNSYPATHRHYLEDLPPQPLIDKPYSLIPDMIFGWVPKIQFNGSIPLKFKSDVADMIIRELSNPRCAYYSLHKVCFSGFRPLNSIEMHEKYANSSENHTGYSFKYDAKFLKEVAGLTMVNRESFQSNENNAGKNNPMYAARKDILKFESTFESGNLDLAVKVADQSRELGCLDEYDLYMRVDSNTKGHLQWYYFTVSNTRRHQKVKFNICNFYKKKSLYSRGMKPYVSSKRAQEKKKESSERNQKAAENEEIEELNDEGFEQAGNNVSYRQQKFRYGFLYGISEDDQDEDEDDDDQGTPAAAGRKQPYCLSFEYEFLFDNDEVSFAFCVPYTYTRLQKFIRRLVSHHGSSFLTEEKLCQSLSGADVPLLTITDNCSDVVRKQVVLINARIHPGESNSSWVMHGFLNFLCGSSTQAASLRKTTIFKVVPMLNPDGVILGNYRSGLAGRDLNRVFQSSDKTLFPTVIALKELANQLKLTYAKRFSMFVDLHGHSVKKNAFVYGPDFPIYDLHYLQCRALPKLIGDSTSMFRYHSSIFKVSKGKRNTGRAVLFRQFNIPMSFTLEASNGMFGNGIPFNSSKYLEMGATIGKAAFSYFMTIVAFEERAAQKKKQKQVSQSCSSASSMQIVRVNANLRDDEEANGRVGVGDDDEEFCRGNVAAEVVSRAKKAIKRSVDTKKRKKNKKSKGYEEGTTLSTAVVEESPFLELFKNDNPFKIGKNKEATGKEEDQHESDDFSEGGSDSESSDEDFDKKELEMMRKNIEENQKAIQDILSSKNKFTKALQNSKRPSSSTHQIKIKPSSSTADSNFLRSRKDSASLENSHPTGSSVRLTSGPLEKRGGFITKTIRPSTTTMGSTRVIKQADSVKVEDNSIKEFNSQTRRYSGYVNMNKGKSEQIPGSKQSSHFVAAASDFIPLVKPLKNKADSLVGITSRKDLTKDQLIVGSKKDLSNRNLEDMNMKGLSSKSSKFVDLHSAIRNNCGTRLDEGITSGYHLVMNTPTQIIGQDIPDSTSSLSSRRVFESFRQKNNIPSAFYAIQKHFSFRKKDDIPINGTGSVQLEKSNSSSAVPLLANINKPQQKNKSFSYQAQSFATTTSLSSNFGFASKQQQEF